MSEEIYNKLVRDNIPEIIASSNKKCEIKIVEKDELTELLNLKLQEEVSEYLESNEVEELADILEVIYGILDSKNISKEELEDIRIKKKEERGGFKEGIKLIKVLSK